MRTTSRPALVLFVLLLATTALGADTRKPAEEEPSRAEWGPVDVFCTRGDHTEPIESPDQSLIELWGAITQAWKSDAVRCQLGEYVFFAPSDTALRTFILFRGEKPVAMSLDHDAVTAVKTTYLHASSDDQPQVGYSETASATRAMPNEDEALQYEWGPAKVFVWVDTPAEVILGQEFTLNLSLENRRPAEEFLVEAVTLEDTYFSGFEFVGAWPKAKEADAYPDELDLTYDMTIPPMARQEFNIRLRSIKAGIFMGDVDVWEGDDGDSSARVAQTEVKPAK